MATLDDFLAGDPYDENRPKGEIVFETIGLTKVEPAWHAFIYDHKGKQLVANEYFPFVPNLGNQEIARLECQAFIDKHNVEKVYPQLGILISIPEQTNLTDDNVTWDIKDFVSAYDSKKNQVDEGGLHQEFYKDLQADFPYDAILKSIRECNIPLCEWIWAKTAQITNELTRVKGKKNKSGYDFRVRVVRAIYASKEEALEAAELDADYDPADTPIQDGLSKTATDSHWTLASLQSQSQTIHDMIANAIKGEGTPNNEALGPKAANEFVCEQVGIEVGDLKLLGIEIPF